VPVECLALHDTVLTHRGEVRVVTWIGKGTVPATHGRHGAATRVIVRKGALADNVPHRDLYVTKGHSLYLDDVLIPVEFLVNHRSIVWDDRALETDIYHIELAVHDVLLSNGAPAESYRDDGNRSLFQNVDAEWLQPPNSPCAPVLTAGPVVDGIWRSLMDRSGLRLDVPTTDEPDLHLLVDGYRVDGQLMRNGVHAFRLSKPSATVRVVSWAGARDRLGLARATRGCLVWRSGGFCYGGEGNSRPSRPTIRCCATGSTHSRQTAASAGPTATPDCARHCSMVSSPVANCNRTLRVRPNTSSSRTRPAPPIDEAGPIINQPVRLAAVAADRSRG
jgi:hypothetical protein